jgi:hypothetical protein
MNTATVLCKVCDRGALVSKKVFRMSWPVVAIGFILLIPSILGIVFSLIVLVGVNSVSVPHQPTQSAQDATFRKSCKDSFLEQQTRYTQLAQTTAPQFCECTLSASKAGNSVERASETCAEQAVNGTLSEPDDSVNAFYEDASSQSAEQSGEIIGRAIGSGFAIVMCIVSFVGGLLGWLLVMRKRVLQCNDCGAAINAS